MKGFMSLSWRCSKGIVIGHFKKKITRQTRSRLPILKIWATTYTSLRRSLLPKSLKKDKRFIQHGSDRKSFSTCYCSSAFWQIPSDSISDWMLKRNIPHVWMPTTERITGAMQQRKESLWRDRWGGSVGVQVKSHRCGLTLAIRPALQITPHTFRKINQIKVLKKSKHLGVLLHIMVGTFSVPELPWRLRIKDMPSIQPAKKTQYSQQRAYTAFQFSLVT